MIPWKEPNKEINGALRRAFAIYGDPNCQRSPDPDVEYLWATEVEVAKALGRDLSNLDEHEKKRGPFRYDWEEGAEGDDFMRHVSPKEIYYNVISGQLDDGTPVVLADARVQKYNIEEPS